MRTARVDFISGFCLWFSVWLMCLSLKEVERRGTFGEVAGLKSHLEFSSTDYKFSKHNLKNQV